jgi:hypothetical protein
MPSEEDLPSNMNAETTEAWNVPTPEGAAGIIKPNDPAKSTISDSSYDRDIPTIRPTNIYAQEYNDIHIDKVNKLGRAIAETERPRPRSKSTRSTPFSAIEESFMSWKTLPITTDKGFKK